MKAALLLRLKEAVDALTSLPEYASAVKEENEERYFCYIHLLDIESFTRIVAQLAPYADIYSLIAIWETATGSMTFKVTNGKITVIEVSQSTEPDEEVEESEIGSGNDYPEPGTDISEADLMATHQRLIARYAAVTITLQVTLEKTQVMATIQWPADVSAILFLIASKFIELFSGKNCSDLQKLLTPNAEKIIVLLLADCDGNAKGSNLFIYGRPAWPTIQLKEISGNIENKAKIDQALQFRESECQWEVGTICLTPFHLHLESNTLSNRTIIDLFTSQRDRLCVGYLANRMRIRDNLLICDFFGHKHVQVELGKVHLPPSSTALFNLFQWTYENASSDKIGVLRQIVSLQLTEKADKNYSLLLESANTILVSAKSNFQFFLRRSVELYFDKRLKISEFLHKFSNEIGKSVSEIASELINNLYKTVGVVLGVVIAALVDPPKTLVIVHWTSLLYFIYIIFILVLLLPSYYLRYRGNVLEFEHNKAELKDVLLEEEIERIEGGSFMRNKREFLVAFFLANSGYAVFAVIALVIFRSF